MKLYREVKASDRSPESDCIRFVIDENGAKFADRFVQGKWYSYPIHPIKYWLEPIEITEEEIDKEKQVYEVNSPRYMTMMVTREAAFKAGVKWALSKLKGE